VLTPEILAHLGITKEELLDRVAKQVARDLLHGASVDDEGQAWPIDTKFHKEMQELIETELKSQIATHFQRDVVPKLTEITAKMILNRTNRYGERKAKPQTLKEFMVQQTKNFLREVVDSRGQLTTRGNGKTRLETMLSDNMQQVLKMELEDTVSAANEMLAGELQEAVRTRLTALAEKFKIVVKK
jgi:autotransporter translocation and assembly factor TamB